ncbi:MAG: class II aldolase/adducin family protein [Gemmatimonadales bacterium]
MPKRAGGQAGGRAAAARAIVQCCRRLWEAGLIAGADGNVSVRVGPDQVLMTPSGCLKCDLTPGDLVEVDLAGAPRRGAKRRSSRQPSSELDLHLRVYRRRSDCGAVVHAHPPVATAFAVAGEVVPADVLPELILYLGAVPLVPYAMTGTPALGDAVEPFLERHVAVLLANHGAVTWGPDLTTAQIRMESLEHSARILHAARALGRATRLTPEQVSALDQRRGTPGDG